jgi:hypothetical protein
MKELAAIVGEGSQASNSISNKALVSFRSINRNLEPPTYRTVEQLHFPRVLKVKNSEERPEGWRPRTAQGPLAVPFEFRSENPVHVHPGKSGFHMIAKIRRKPWAA